MRRIHTGVIYAAIAGVLALASIGYLQSHTEIDRYSQLAEAVLTVSGEIDSVRDRLTEERIIDLPEDGGAWYTTLIAPSANVKSDPIARRLELNLQTNVRMKSLLTQTHVNRYYPGHPMWDAKYRGIYGRDGTTAIVVQTPEGHVCYKATGASIPSDGNVLADAIAAAVADCRPRPKPKPGPQPGPDQVPVIPDTVPDIGPDDSAAHEENLAAVLILMGLGAGAGAFMAARKEGG